MALMKDYIQTEVGIIPCDWQLRIMRDCCIKITDGTHDTPKPVKSGIPFLTAIHIKDNFIDFENCYYLPRNIHKIIYNRCDPEKDDVLMVNIGSGVATTALVNVDYEFSLKNVALLKPNRSIVFGAYLNYWQLNSKSKIYSISTGGAQPFLSLRQISELKIAVPPLKEQTAIVSALSDIDSLITSLEKLISKKRSIKQGSIQQLMSHKIEHEVKTLGKLFTITAGGDVDFSLFSETQNQFYCYPVYSNALTNNGLYGYTSDYKQVENTITVTARGQIGVANPRNHKYQAIGRLIVLKPNIDIDINYVSEYINNFVRFSNESTGVPQLTAPQISSYEIVIPDFTTQKIVSKTLLDMDFEISALESKLSKYRQIKTGMMQSLLTGKIRLI